MHGMRGSSGIVLLCGMVLCTAAAVWAQDLQPSPMSWDFGNVAVGNSEMVTFDLLAGPPTAVWVYEIGFTETPIPPTSGLPFASPYYSIWSLGAFSFLDTFPTIPVEHSVGSHLYVDVAFTPPAPGEYLAYLYVHSNDSVDGPGVQAFFPLEGTAVVPVPSAALLGVIGIGVAGWWRGRRVR